MRSHFYTLNSLKVNSDHYMCFCKHRGHLASKCFILRLMPSG